MAKNKNNQAIWNTRIKKKASSLFQKVGNSIDIDKRLYKEDIQGSIVHVEMLFKQKIISFKIKNKIIYGLTKIEKEISNKKFEFNKKYEDIHMNIEKRLFQIIGDEAGYVHTARSRNDQVIADFKIWIKSANKEINYKLDSLIKTSLKLAEKNIYTIMPGFTHLKNAQAISFAHYLMAYVEMFSRDKKRFNNNIDNLNENAVDIEAPEALQQEQVVTFIKSLPRKTIQNFYHDYMESYGVIEDLMILNEHNRLHLLFQLTKHSFDYLELLNKEILN